MTSGRRNQRLEQDHQRPRIDFYILPSAGQLARAWTSPASRRKAWRMGHRIYLRAADAGQRDELDAALWRFRPEADAHMAPPNQNPEGQVVLGLRISCGDHHDLLVNLDLKVPVLPGVSPACGEVVMKFAIRQAA